MKNCKFCTREFSPQQIKRSHGEFSPVFFGGFCSSFCYTQHLMAPKNSPTYTLTHDQLWDLIQEAKNEGINQGGDTYGQHTDTSNDKLLSDFLLDEEIVANVEENDQLCKNILYIWWGWI